MPFRFSLEPVLRLRRSEQRQQELLLQKATEQVNRIVLDLKAQDEEIRMIGTANKNSPQISGAEMKFDGERCGVLAQRRAQTVLRLAEASERQLLAVQEFLKIWQKREALEVLRGHEQRAYALEEDRRQQRAQDELLLRMRRNLPRALGKRCPSS